MGAIGLRVHWDMKQSQVRYMCTYVHHMSCHWTRYGIKSITLHSLLKKLSCIFFLIDKQVTMYRVSS